MSSATASRVLPLLPCQVFTPSPWPPALRWDIYGILTGCCISYCWYFLALMWLLYPCELFVPCPSGKAALSWLRRLSDMFCLQMNFIWHVSAKIWYLWCDEWLHTLSWHRLRHLGDLSWISKDLSDYWRIIWQNSKCSVFYFIATCENQLGGSSLRLVLHSIFKH